MTVSWDGMHKRYFYAAPAIGLQYCMYTQQSFTHINCRVDLYTTLVT